MTFYFRFSIEDQTVVGSFPIDVVVSVFVQPCVLLFTCLPSDPMECILRLPAVDVLLSSKRTVTDNQNQSILGGLSFTLCMKDFKLSIYHPYSTDGKVQMQEDSRSGQNQTRNALSVSVQSVTVNISRSRMLLVDDSSEPMNSIELSVVAQISSAQFECDIRRFSKMVTFPKIWYNQALARRLFLGDQTLTTRIRSSPVVTRRIAPLTILQKSSRKQARILIAVQLKELHISMRMSNIMGKVEWQNNNMALTGSLKFTSEGERIYQFSLGLESSMFQADQGIVGGSIRLKKLRTSGAFAKKKHTL